MRTETQNCVNQATNVALHMSAMAGIGYLAARVFSFIDPVHAALFSASTYLVSKIISPLFEKTFGGWASSEASRFTGNLLALGTAVAISSGISMLAGFPVSFTAGVALTCTIVAVGIFSAMVINLANQNQDRIQV